MVSFFALRGLHPNVQNKGDRGDKRNYRSLVMLSVSAKLVARIAASWLGQWTETWMPEEQNEFRPGQQFLCRLLEDVSVSAAPEQVGLTCFDIVRAYTRVCRAALWQLLCHLGLPQTLIRVLNALHERTTFQVFVRNGYSSP